jgi:hypothetical protein
MYSNVPPTSGLKFTKSSSAPSAVNGDEWYNTTNSTIYKYIDGKLVLNEYHTNSII